MEDVARVLVARDGVEALDLMQTNNPDLVFCDLRMPRMDGVEFLRELCRTQGREHPPVLALTALVSEADHQRTQAAGFEGHLNTPFDDAALVSAVRIARPAASGDAASVLRRLSATLSEL